MGKLAAKLVAEGLKDASKLWPDLSFAGRKGRGAIDSVMLAMEVLRKPGGRMMRDIMIKSGFNSLDRRVMYTTYTVRTETCIVLHHNDYVILAVILAVKLAVVPGVVLAWLVAAFLVVGLAVILVLIVWLGFDSGNDSVYC